MPCSRSQHKDAGEARTCGLSVSSKALSHCAVMDRWIDGWMDGWMDGRTDGRTDGRMDGWMDVKLYKKVK